MIDNTTENNFISQIVLPPIEQGGNERLYLIKDKYAHDNIETLQSNLTSLNTELNVLDTKINNLNIPNTASLVTVNGLNNVLSNFITRAEVNNSYIRISTLLANYTNNTTLDANYVHKTNDVIDNASITYNNVDGLYDNYAHIDANNSIDNAYINYLYISGLYDNYAHVDSNNNIDNANIDYENINNLYTNYAHIGNNNMIDNADIDYTNVTNLYENYAHIGDNNTIDNADIDYTNITNLYENYAHIGNNNIIDNASINYANIQDLNTHYAEIENGKIKNATIDQANVENLNAHYAEIENGKIKNATIDQANVENLNAHYAEIESGRIINATIDQANIENLNSNYAHITNGTIDNASIDQARINNLSAYYAHINEGYIDNAMIDQANIDNLDAHYAHIEEGIIDNASIDYANVNNLDAHYAHITNGVIDNANIDQANVNNLEANYAHITNGVIDNATISYADIDDLEANYAHITNGVIDRATIDYANVNDLEANYAHITDGVIDNATIGYADVNDLNAHYAEIDIANVNNAWIENGVIKDAAISDAKIIGVSANKLTAGTIDASNINVTNLRADNLIVTRINGQPVIGGYTLVHSSISNYLERNPSQEGWYEFSNNIYTLSADTLVDETKVYYRSSDSVELYDQATIDGMVDGLNARIDSQIETWTTDAVPTLNNYPAEDWTTTALKQEHIGDICYVINAGNSYDGFTYRFAYDNTSQQYMWVLIKDNQVTAALGRLTNAENKITGLETFETNTSTWITQTDQGLETIRSNYTTLSGRVDKTVTSTAQLWFTKANTTAPTAPTSIVTNNNATGANSYNQWNLAVPEYNVNYPYYYYCWQYTFEDDTTGWSAVIYDRATTEAEERARTGITNAAAAQSTANSNIKSSVMLWFSQANDTSAPQKPNAVVTNNNPTGANSYNKWNLAVPIYNSSYPYYYYCYQQQKGDGTYQWTDVIYDRATTETQSTTRATSSSLSNYITNNDAALAALQSQVDNQLEVWYGNSNPTNSTQPASSWDNDEKANHVGDLYYNTTDGSAWQWTVDNSVYSWIQIPDSAASAALAAAQDAQATADGKRRIFTSTPTVPYDIGDLWVTGNQVKYATVKKTESQNYAVADWSQTATDDTMASANIKSSVQLWYTSNSTTSPDKPYTDGSSNYVSSTSTNGNTWTTIVPLYNSSTPKYHYCYQQQRGDGKYQWTTPVYDDATTTAMAKAQSALPAATFETFEQSTFKDVVDTVDEQSSTITTLTTITENNGLTTSTNITNAVNSVSQTATSNSSKISALTTALGTNADGTSATNDIIHKVSDIEQDLDGITTRVGKTESALKGTYATCPTATEAQAKVATVFPTIENYELYAGETITVKFTNSNTSSAPTLNVNNTGAKAIKTYSGANLSEAEYKWDAGSTMAFIYDGTYWRIQDSTELTRIKNAESSITQTANSITSLVANTETYTAPDGTTKANTIRSAIKQNADNIALRVEKSGVIAAINASIESDGGSAVKISADKVNIEGAAIFTGNGRLSTTSLNNAYDVKGAASEAQTAAINAAAADATSKANAAQTAAETTAAADATSKADAAQSAAISAAATDATNKADTAQTAATNYTDTQLTNYSTTTEMNAAIGNAVDNLEIGGRNLLKNTNWNTETIALFTSSNIGLGNSIDQWSKENAANLSIVNDFLKIETTASSGRYGLVQDIILDVGTYTLSGDFDTSWQVGIGNIQWPANVLTNTNGKKSYTFNVAAAGTWRVYVAATNGNPTYANYLKLEKGSKATDWTFAPEDAINKEQIIYIQAVSGTNSMTAYPSTATTTTSYWVTQTGESIPSGTPPLSASGQTPRWTLKRPSYQTNYPIIFVATQRQTVGGTITCTTPIKDDTLTIIDGGHITTGIIDATAVTVINLNANNITSGSLTSTNYQGAAAGIPYSIMGSKIELSTGNIYTPSFGVINSSSNTNYPVGLYINDGFVAKSGKIGWSSENYWDVGTLPINSSNYTTGIVATGNSLINVGELILESNDDLNNNASLHTGTISKSSTTYTRNYLRDSDNYYRDYGLQAPVLDSTAANYTAGVDDNFIYIKKSPTNSNTLPTLESDWDYLFRIDKEGNVYTTGSMYINGQLVQSGGNFVAVSGDSTINGTLTIANGSLVGQLNKSITFAASGGASAGSTFNNTNNLTVSYATIGAASAGHTHDYLPLSGGTLSGNLNFSATSSINWTSGTVRQRILITDDSTANTNVFEFQQSTNSGSNYTSLFTIKDNGTVVATTFSGALSGNATSATTATSATKDSEGNQISTTYLKLNGGTLTGDLTTSGDIVINGDLYTNNELYADSETVGSLIVTGNATFNNGLTGNLTGTAEKATKDSAGNQINTTYIKGLSISGKTITYTKGDNTTGTITTQDTTYTNGTGLSLNGTQFYVTSANVSTMINLLTEGASPANRNDYAVVQYVNGGTTTTTYHRRKLSNVFAALNASDITTALGFTPYNNTNPNSFTSNTGTVTSVTLKAGNGITLDTDNTAITTTGTRTISHADTSNQASITASDRTYIKSVTLDTYGHVTGLTTGTETVTNTHNTAYLYAGTSSGSANAQTTNGNTYLILKDGNSVSSRNKITGSGTVSVASDANGVITITGSAHPTALKNPNALAINIYNGSATATTTNYDGATANQSVNVASNNAITGISASTSGGSTTFTLTTAAGGTSTFDVNITGAVVTGATTLTGSDGTNINVGGATTAPVYFSEGLPVAVTSIPYSLISGKPTITLNGSATNTPSWYAPTAVGTSGQILKSNGSGAPSWVNTSTITAGAATKATNDSDGNAINSTYLKKSGGIMTGALKTAGSDIVLGTSGTSSEDSGDLVWHHSDGTEKGRIWMPNAPTVKQGPNYRILNLEGTTLYTGTLPLGDGTGASGTWGISISGNAATATSATSATKLGSSNVGAADRPIYLSAGTATQITYRMAATNSAVTTARAITENLETGIWYVNGTNSTNLYSINDGAAYVNKYSDSWIAEIYQDYRTGQIALRGKNNGTWQDWRKVLDSSNFNTWAPKLDGTGATGTWEISISGNAATATSATSATTATSATNDSDGNAINSTYLKKSGGTMTGAINTANNTWNKIGDDIQIGDINEAGTLGIQGVNGNTAIRFTTYNQTTKTTGGKISWDGTNFTITGTVSTNISGNAATASAAPWSGITDKPATATRWPAWNEISQTGANSIEEGSSDLTDNSEILTSYASNNGFADSNATGKVYRRDAIHIYNYIKNKTDSIYVKKAGDTMTGALTTTNLGITNTDGSTGYGISLYNGGSTVDKVWSYGLAFAGTSKFGKHGYVQGNWATYFTMTGETTRGWIFKHGGFQNTSGNVASINSQGKFQGLSYSVDGHCNLEYNTTTESLNFVFS